MVVQRAVPLLVGLFFAVAIALPLVRLWVRTGTFGFVGHRSRDPLARAIGLGFVGLCAAGGAWTVALAAVGPARLGGWGVPPAATAIGLGAMVAGIALTAVAQAQMGSSWRIGIDAPDRPGGPTALVDTGLYALSRNPIYTGLLVFVAGVVAAAPSTATVVGAAAIGAVIAIEARLEEGHLRETHGEAFAAYARRVGRFFPGIGRLR
ncbi:MAG: methyltransferase [Myxococcota bacterium]